MAKPLIITVAAVGAELSKKQTPFLPVTPDEIAHEAYLISQLGVQVVHLHVRDSKGKPTLSVSTIKSVIKKIRAKSNIIIQLSTGGSVHDSFSSRVKVLDAKPQMASLTLGSVNFGKDVFLNPTPFVEKLAARMLRLNIKPELEIFDVGMVDQANYLIRKKLLKPPHHFNIILGGPGWLAATEENIECIIKRLPKESSWSASGIGRHQKVMIEYAIANGGHVRTGLEDNIYLSQGVLAKGNVELVEEVILLAQKYKRKLLALSDTKQFLGIKR